MQTQKSICYIVLCTVVHSWCYFLFLFLYKAIAVVLGFLVVVGLIILLVFAVKTRGQIRRYGRERVLWYDVKTITDGLTSQGIGEWVRIFTSNLHFLFMLVLCFSLFSTMHGFLRS